MQVSDFLLGETITFSWPLENRYLSYTDIKKNAPIYKFHRSDIKIVQLDMWNVNMGSVPTTRVPPKATVFEYIVLPSYLKEIWT